MLLLVVKRNLIIPLKMLFYHFGMKRFIVKVKLDLELVFIGIVKNSFNGPLTKVGIKVEINLFTVLYLISDVEKGFLLNKIGVGIRVFKDFIKKNLRGHD